MPPPPQTPLPEADEDPHPAIELDLIDPLNLLSPSDHTNISTWASLVFEQFKATGSVRAKIVNDQLMSDAHQKFSGIDGTTDVLTFDFNPTDQTESKALDTDLIICADQAARQATQHNNTTPQEILLYIIHGILHCMGYDDQSTSDFNKMHQREDQLLTAAGIGPLFTPQNQSKGNTK